MCAPSVHIARTWLLPARRCSSACGPATLSDPPRQHHQTSSPSARTTETCNWAALLIHRHAVLMTMPRHVPQTFALRQYKEFGVGAAAAGQGHMRSRDVLRASTAKSSKLRSLSTTEACTWEKRCSQFQSANVHDTTSSFPQASRPAPMFRPSIMRVFRGLHSIHRSCA
jgi:hypothetical protein